MNRPPSRFAAVLASALAAACAATQSAPIAYGRSAPASPAPAVFPSTTSVETAPEPNWAAGEGTPLSAYALRPNAAHPFDPAHLPRTHRVRAGESLYDVASMYQVPLRALIDANRLEPPYTLEPGRDVALPPPRVHTAARGEALGDIARRYNVDLRSLALLNRMQPPYLVSAGDRIVLPAIARPAPAEPAASPPESSSAGVSRFVWPLRGAIVARFGVQPDGAHLDGVEIAGAEGAAIAAAAAGEVVYAGSDLPGYGVLVLVRHADNYVTAYAHGRRALVREGQSVRTGETLAELGSRSDGRARLLFQVRQGARPVDPLPLLGLSP